jgi:hypothetical protein
MLPLLGRYSKVVAGVTPTRQPLVLIHDDAQRRPLVRRRAPPSIRQWHSWVVFDRAMADHRSSH